MAKVIQSIQTVKSHMNAVDFIVFAQTIMKFGIADFNDRRGNHNPGSPLMIDHMKILAGQPPVIQNRLRKILISRKGEA
jgi:hypothetical protein